MGETNDEEQVLPESTKYAACIYWQKSGMACDTFHRLNAPEVYHEACKAASDDQIEPITTPNAYYRVS